MNPTDLESADAVLVVNLALAGLCLGAVLVVVVAAVLDGLRRRRTRRGMPDGWPPA